MISSLVVMSRSHPPTGGGTAMRLSVYMPFSSSAASAPAAFELGLLHERAGRVVQAKAAYERCLELDPTAASARNNLALLLVRDPRTRPRALGLVEGITRDHLDEPALLDTAGWVYLKAGQADRGRALLHLAWEGAPSEPEIGYHLAEAIAVTGDLGAALEVLDEVFRLGRGFPAADEAVRLRERLVKEHRARLDAPPGNSVP